MPVIAPPKLGVYLYETSPQNQRNIRLPGKPFGTTWCTKVRNRGIRIAMLYTEYLPLPTNSWYNQYVAPFNGSNPATGQIATNLQSCASPGLFYDVQSGGDITAALNALFQLWSRPPRI